MRRHPVGCRGAQLKDMRGRSARVRRGRRLRIAGLALLAWLLADRVRDKVLLDAYRSDRHFDPAGRRPAQTDLWFSTAPASGVLEEEPAPGTGQPARIWSGAYPALLHQQR
jgi:hypothetical protein